MPDLILILESVAALMLLAAILFWVDRRTLPRRHHDHLIPGTPRSARGRR